MNGQLEASLSLLACIVLFGVQFIPAKRNETYNGTVFHWFMCSGSLFTGLVLGVLLAGDFPVGTLEGLCGGALVAISNTLILHVKQTLGLFSGVVIYQAANLITGYSVGRFGLFGAQADPGRIPWLRDLGVAAFLLSLALAFLADPKARANMLALSAPIMMSDGDDSGDSSHHHHHHHQHQHHHRQPGGLSEVQAAQLGGAACGSVCVGEAGSVHPRGTFQLPGFAQSCQAPFMDTERSAAEAAMQHALDHESWHHGLSHGEHLPHPPVKSSWRRKFVGALLAVMAGFFRGVNPVPFYDWRLAHPHQAKGAFVFPQALGVWAAGTIIYLGYATGKKVLHMHSPHHPHIRPAFLSGCLWAGGFVCFAHALDGLGFTVVYSLSSIGSVFISLLLSVVVFREVQEPRQLRLFCLCGLIQLGGMVLIVSGS